MEISEGVHNGSVVSVQTSEATQFNIFADRQNSTNADQDINPRLNYAVLALIPLILIIAIGNVLVITLVGIDRRLRSATNCFLSSLAVADMLVALIVMPLSLSMIVNNYNWPFSDELCGLWVMLDVFFSTCSILHLCMISFDRYMALAQPFSRRHSRTTYGNTSSVSSHGGGNKKQLRRAAKRIFFVWSVALGIAIPIPILGKLNRENLFVGQMCAINIAEFQIYGSLAAFFLPLVIMFIMYTLTIRSLNRQARLVSNIMVQNSPPNTFSRSLRNRSLYSSLRRKEPVKSKEHLNGWSRVSQAIALENNNVEIDVFSSDMQADSTQFVSRSCYECRSKNTPSDDVAAETSSWRKALRMITNLFHRIQGTRKSSTNSMNMTALKNKCTCRNNRNDIECNSIKNTREVMLLRQQSRSYRATHGRASSSFKNRAMASINNEQKASKVLGLIFVLFCLFWCPFFITNVTSRLCSTCDQELMGNFMNWFVWVGYVSSGVNPCVYTMFSRRFRRTFFLVIKGKFSEINKDPHFNPPFSRRATSAIPSRNSRVSLRPSITVSTYPTLKPSVSSLDEEDFVKSKNKLEIPSYQQKHSGKSERANLKLWRSSSSDSKL